MDSQVTTSKIIYLVQGSYLERLGIGVGYLETLLKRGMVLGYGFLVNDK